MPIRLSLKVALPYYGGNMNSGFTPPPAPIFPTPNTESVKRVNYVPLTILGVFGIIGIYFLCCAFTDSQTVVEAAPFSSSSAPALDSAKNIIARAPSGVIEPPATATPVIPVDIHRVEQKQKFGKARSMELREKALASTGIVPVVNREAKALRESSQPLARFDGNNPFRNADVDSAIQGLIAAHGLREGDANGQTEKEAFLKSQRDDFRLDSPMIEPQGFREIKTGSVIPATLITGVNSDLPGELIGQVARNVFDSRTGDVLLIPAGTKLFGRYDSAVVYGQARVLIAWDRLIHPDGRAIALKSMSGADVTGAAGFADEVHNHYGRIFGSALLMSAISAGVQLSQPSARTFGGYDAQQQIAASLGQQMGQVGMEVTRKNLNVQPTIVIRPGHRFNVIVNKDILIPERNGETE